MCVNVVLYWSFLKSGLVHRLQVRVTSRMLAGVWLPLTCCLPKHPTFFFQVAVRNVPLSGSISHVVVQLPHVFRRLEAENVTSVIDTRYSVFRTILLCPNDWNFRCRWAYCFLQSAAWFHHRRTPLLVFRCRLGSSQVEGSTELLLTKGTGESSLGREHQPLP